MRSVQMTTDVLTALKHVVRGVEFKPEQTRAACTSELLATQRALQQVTEGVPFRAAYQQAESGDGGDGSVDPAAVLDAYETDGSPGQERPDLVRDRLREHRKWVADG
jgi:argininosuccinate lyase